MEHSRNRSRKRDAILAVLQSTVAHPTAEWILAQLKADYPELSLGTVYRNLRLFQAEGRVMTAASVRGFERFDANVAPHSHFICDGCGSVTDLPAAVLPAELLETAARQAGSIPRSWNLNFHGLCPECQGKTPHNRVPDSSKKNFTEDQ